MSVDDDDELTRDMDTVYINLTKREDRRKLIYWSDLTTTVPEVTGDDSIDMDHRYQELMQAAGACLRNKFGRCIDVTRTCIMHG